MAQSDWITISTTANNYFNSISGTAVQHNSITTPITSSGVWFREFNSTGPSSHACAALIPINNSILTSSVGYPYGYTYSMRCWMKLPNVFGGNSSYGYAARPGRICLSFKNVNNLNPQNFYNNLLVRGYSLTFSEGANTVAAYDANPNVGLILRCINNTSSIGSISNSVDPVNVNNAYQHTILNNITDHNVWKRFRMDVSSLPNSDIITVFSGSQVEGQWSQLHQVEIPRTKVAAYVPWNNHPIYPSDNTGAATAGHMGIIYANYSNSSPLYVDGFEVYREAITI